MREYILYLWIGVWLLLLPFFGIPGSWKDTFLILTALFIIVHTFLGHRRSRQLEADTAENGEVSAKKGSEEETNEPTSSSE